MSSLTPEAPQTQSPLDLNLKRPSMIGFIGVLMLVGIFGIWMGLTVIGGAVVAQGETVVKGKPQVVQSLNGGVVDAILVHDGDIVTAGDTIIQLDPTVLAVNLDIAQQRLAASLALQSRLTAEYQGAESLEFDYPPLPFTKPETKTNEASQQAIFEARNTVRAGNVEKLAETLSQFDNQIIGAQGQIKATDAQISSLLANISTQKRLVSQGLARQGQLSALERSHSELAGRQAGLNAEIARLKNARQDAKLSALQEEHGFLEDVATQMRTATGTTQELILEITTHLANLEQTDIRAPASGIVHDMQISTTGAVIAPGGTVGQIVPLKNGMEFTLQVDPREIDQVYVGQEADIILSGFDRQTTPKLEAKVTSVSAGAIPNAQTGRSYYTVLLSVDRSELVKMEGNTLKPGMPVEAYLKTGNRTVLSYLLQPVSSHIRRAFRE